MAAQDGQSLLSAINGADRALNSAQRTLRGFLAARSRGNYNTTTSAKAKGSLSNDLRFCATELAKARQAVEDMIGVARANDIMPSSINDIEILNANMMRTYEGAQGSLRDLLAPKMVDMDAAVNDTISVATQIRESMSKISSELKGQSANKKNGGSRKRKHHKRRTHRKRKHHKRRTHRK